MRAIYRLGLTCWCGMSCQSDSPNHYGRLCGGAARPGLQLPNSRATLAIAGLQLTQSMNLFLEALFTN